MIRDMEIEDDNDEYILIPKLKDLQKELLEECLKDQINDPYSSSTNFIEPYKESVFMALRNDLSEETKASILEDNDNFYTSILEMINDKFDLGIDMTAISNDRDYLMNLTEAIYEFFIINYMKNIKKFFVKFITHNQSDIAEMFDNGKKKDVSTIAFKKKIVSKDIATILANIDSVLSYIYNLNIDSQEFISFFNQDKYEVRVISDAINNFIITGDFVGEFLSDIGINKQTGGYDTIIVKIQNSLYEKNKRNDIRKELNDGE